MQTINVKEIIDQKGLDVKEVAFQLFPKTKYPRLALNRVIQGKANLQSDQISKLASLVGVSISELYSGADWKAISNAGKHVFTNGDFRAELDTNTWITKIFHNESMFHESVIHSGSIALSEYLKELDLIITNFKQQL